MRVPVPALSVLQVIYVPGPDYQRVQAEAALLASPLLPDEPLIVLDKRSAKVWGAGAFARVTWCRHLPGGTARRSS